MLTALELAYLLLQEIMFGCWKCPVQETVADVADRLGGRMAHVLSVETVVAQLVHHDLICREIVGRVQVCRKILYEILYPQEQGGLADLVPVCSVLEMTYRTDCEDELFAFAAFCAGADVYDSIKGIRHFRRGKSFPDKF